MAAGTTILLKRKAGAFTGGDLATGEAGVDITNGDLYFSTDGSTVIQIDVSDIGSGGDALTSNSLAQFAATTSAELAALISDEEGSGAVVFNSSPTITTPTLTLLAGAGSITAGAIEYNGANAITVGNGTSAMTFTDDANLSITESQISDFGTYGDVTKVATPVNDQVGVWTGDGTLEGDTALTFSGTQLNVNGAKIQSAGFWSASTTATIGDSSLNTIFQGVSVVSPVCYIELGNAATGNDVHIEAKGTDTNINLDLVSKGSGNVLVNGAAIAMVADNLSVFAATTSAQFAGVISDETGTGSVVFGTDATITTPALTLTNSAGPSPTTEAVIEWDNGANTICIGDGSTTKIFSADDDLLITESQISDLGTYIPTSDLLDEDTMSSDSSTKPASQQSIKAYVDAASGGSPTGPIKWTYNATTTDADPTAGLFRADTTNPSTAAWLYVDDTPTGGSTIDAGVLVDRLRSGALILATDDNTGEQHLFQVTDSPTDGTGYWKIPIDALSAHTSWNTGTYEFSIISIGGDIGKVDWHGSSTVPDDHLECDGSAVSRTTYVRLFDIIGTTWGVGDGSTTFNLPDLRGEFIRGWDNGKGTDSGRSFASSQTDMVDDHVHSESRRGTNNVASGNNKATASTAISYPNTGGVASATAGSETRPRNYALMAIIRYQ